MEFGPAGCMVKLYRIVPKPLMAPPHFLKINSPDNTPTASLQAAYKRMPNLERIGIH